MSSARFRLGNSADDGVVVMFTLYGLVAVGWLVFTLLDRIPFPHWAAVACDWVYYGGLAFAGGMAALCLVSSTVYWLVTRLRWWLVFLIAAILAGWWLFTPAGRPTYPTPSQQVHLGPSLGPLVHFR